MSTGVPASGWEVSDPDVDWASLTAEAKHERILCAAGGVFSRDGLGAPMPAVAAAAGAGIASVYRQFPSKHDLLAALVVRRLDHIAAAAQQALDREGSRWDAMREMLWTIVDREHGDDFLGDAWAQVIDIDAGVIEATDRAMALLDRVIDGARAEGRLRSDATTLDLRLLFTATRAVAAIEPGARRRMLELMLDAFAVRP